MYESKGISVMFVLMVVLVYAGQAAADFSLCFGTCTIGCITADNKFACTTNCLAKCILTPPRSASTSTKLYCKFGCAVDQCAKFGNDVKKVDNCVSACETGKCGYASSQISG